MRIDSIELRRISMPLVSPFRTSQGTDEVHEVLLVRVDTPDAQGRAECVALTEPVYSSEYADVAQEMISRYLAPAVFALPDVTAACFAPTVASIKGHPMAKAALETAILDVELRTTSTSFGDYLGATRDAVDSGVSVGIMDSTGELLDAVDAYLKQGYVRIKLKIEPGWDLEPVRAVRERFGDIVLQVDANCAYSLHDARHLARLDDFDLLLIEQPLAEDDLPGHAALAQRISTPVCLDESITSARVAAQAISIGACAIVNIKPGRVGGYLEAGRIHDVCAAHDVPVWCGGMLETGIGRAPNVALAALPNFTIPGDMSASDRYYAQDLTEPFVLESGSLKVPRGPGIGVNVLPDVLESVTTDVHYLRR